MYRKKQYITELGSLSMLLLPPLSTSEPHPYASLLIQGLRASPLSYDTWCLHEILYDTYVSLRISSAHLLSSSCPPAFSRQAPRRPPSPRPPPLLQSGLYHPRNARRIRGPAKGWRSQVVPMAAILEVQDDRVLRGERRAGVAGVEPRVVGQAALPLPRTGLLGAEVQSA